MTCILIFGNSGSGKSTLARKMSSNLGLGHLDLDLLAWKPTSPPQRYPVDVSTTKILEFIKLHKDCVIEGCYTDLLEIAALHSTEVIFMNLPIEACIENARRRPWESHKYESPEAQDANLPMLLEWIAQYRDRTDTFSEASHTRFYDMYDGLKRMIVTNE